MANAVCSRFLPHEHIDSFSFNDNDEATRIEKHIHFVYKHVDNPFIYLLLLLPLLLEKCEKP